MMPFSNAGAAKIMPAPVLEAAMTQQGCDAVPSSNSSRWTTIRLEYPSPCWQQSTYPRRKYAHPEDSITTPELH